MVELLFLLIAGCLLLLAGLFILPPLWRPRLIAPAAMDERNIAIAKQQLAELNEQRQANTLSQAQYDEQRTELERALSDDLSIAQPETIRVRGRWVSYLLIVLIPALAISLYAGLGNFKAINPTPEMLASPNTELPNQAAMQKMVAGLAEKMQKDPNNAEGWLMLGKSYKYLEQYEKSADAFAHAYQLLGDKPDVMLAYAEALSFTNNDNITGNAEELVFKALKMEPNNPNALWLAGMAKAQVGEFMAAKELWTKLAKTLPEGSEALQETLALLAKVDKKITEANGAEPSKAPESTAAVSSVSVDMQISLAPELQSRVSPTDTLFVYAQAATGGKMPLAIVRKQVQDLPLSISLTDSLAMTPAAKLSMFADVKLLARISKSGNAMQQAGDLIGSMENIRVADKTRHILIINSITK